MGFEHKMSDDGVEYERKREHTREVVPTSEFCKLLGKNIGLASMDVRIRDEELLALKSAAKIEVGIANGRSISLAEVLSKYSLVPKTKLVLAYILAKSVWQFYDSDFMGVSWTTKSIQLFREGVDADNDDEPGVDWAPYYAFSLEQMVERGSVERLPRGQFLHRYPRILALGAILYELAQKNRWGKQAVSSAPASSTNRSELPTLEKTINDISFKIHNGVHDEEWPSIDLKNIQTLEDYRAIVTNCASEDFFRPDPEEKSLNSAKSCLQKTVEEAEEELTVAERRAILFKKVVAPLKEIVQTTGWVDELGNIQRYYMKGATIRLKDVGIISEEPLIQASQASEFVTNSGNSALHALDVSN